MNIIDSLILFFFILLTTGTAFSQELVPRRWSHLPMSTNFAGAGYAFTLADIRVDPVFQADSPGDGLAPATAELTTMSQCAFRKVDVNACVQY